MKKFSVWHNRKAVIIFFFLFIIHMNVKAQLCIEFDIYKELNNSLEKEIDKRINTYCIENDVNIKDVLVTFNTYLINAGFCAPDSISSGYSNFFKHISVPTDKTTIIRSLDSTFIQHLISMFEELSKISKDQMDCIFFIDNFNYIKKKCQEVGSQSEFGGVSEYCPLIQLFDSTLFGNFFLHFIYFSKVMPRCGFIKEVAKWNEEFEVCEKSTYQSFLLFLLSKYPFINRIINGEVIFCYGLLDNSEDIIKENEIIINSEFISEIPPIQMLIDYIYTPTGELEDVKFIQLGGEILKEEVSEEIKSAFKNSTFIVGVYENNRVKYYDTKHVRYK